MYRFVLVGLLGVAGCAPGEVRAEPYELDLSTICINPAIYIDGVAWETTGVKPDAWSERESIVGRFEMSGDKGTFVAVDGRQLEYRRIEGFGAQDCKLG